VARTKTKQAAGASPKDPAPRTRAERVVRDVLEATIEELGRTGFAALSVEDVAKRAGVNKTTVYRRWPTKSQLVEAAFRRMGQDISVPDTGSLRGDLRALVKAKLEVTRTPRGKALMRGLRAEALSRDLLDISRRIRDQDVRMYGTIFDRARARGEIRRGVSNDLVMEAIEGAFTVRFLNDGYVLTPPEAMAVIDLVLKGAMPRS
jgi:AcrR family transcriptional regulator